MEKVTAKKRRFRFRLTIGTKLVSLIAFVLVAAVASVVWVSTKLFVEDNTALIQQMNADAAGHQATRIREQFENLTQKMQVLGTLSVAPSAENEALSRRLVGGGEEILAFFVFDLLPTGPAPKTRTVSPQLEKWGDPTGAISQEKILQEKTFSLAQLEKGEVQVSATRFDDANGMLLVGLPFAASSPDKFTHALIAAVPQARLVKAFGESDVLTAFLVDRKGNLLAHPDASLLANTENLASLEIVKQLLSGKFNNGQTRYVEEESKEAHLGAFAQVGFGGLGVVAEVPEAKAFEAAKRVQYRSLLVAALVLCIAFLGGFLYSSTLTWPIKQLAHAAEKIAHGDFNIKLKPRSRDELGDLSVAFNEMAMGLEERDRVKETFNKFHNKEIAEKLLSGEVKLGGDRKTATVFFSDIRGFTSLSESMSPEEVVVMLNEYMTRMVGVIRRYGGVVDKYVGDAIMALWGVPVEGEDDAAQAVRACLAMRIELAELNAIRIARGQEALKIGMGLNRGMVIAGNIGSDEKMEYTVIGDSVNTASRIESMTKEFGTDLLVSQSVADELKGQFIFTPCEAVRVKGKADALQIFRVEGYLNEAGAWVEVKTEYSDYEKSKSDKAVHEEEAKKAA